MTYVSSLLFIKNIIYIHPNVNLIQSQSDGCTKLNRNLCLNAQRFSNKQNQNKNTVKLTCCFFRSSRTRRSYNEMERRILLNSTERNKERREKKMKKKKIRYHIYGNYLICLLLRPHCFKICVLVVLDSSTCCVIL